MPEIKGKMETSYEWTCSACGTTQKRIDMKQCVKCEKKITDEKVLRHFKLTPEPIKLGFVV